jgi:3-mercaptopyruvate sulfurtransferase SseA
MRHPSPAVPIPFLPWRLVLSELLGFSSVKNYEGSWTEYGSLVGVPVEVGA